MNIKLIVLGFYCLCAVGCVEGSDSVSSETEQTVTTGSVPVAAGLPTGSWFIESIVDPDGVMSLGPLGADELDFRVVITSGEALLATDDCGSTLNQVVLDQQDDGTLVGRESVLESQSMADCAFSVSTEAARFRFVDESTITVEFDGSVTTLRLTDEICPDFIEGSC